MAIPIVSAVILAATHLVTPVAVASAALEATRFAGPMDAGHSLHHSSAMKVCVWAPLPNAPRTQRGMTAPRVSSATLESVQFVKSIGACPTSCGSPHTAVREVAPAAKKLAAGVVTMAAAVAMTAAVERVQNVCEAADIRCSKG